MAAASLTLHIVKTVFVAGNGGFSLIEILMIPTAPHRKFAYVIVVCGHA